MNRSAGLLQRNVYKVNVAKMKNAKMTCGVANKDKIKIY